MALDELGSQEAAVLAAIAANPFIGQQEIADSLGLARSTVAAHIAQLTRKGYILGRGYMLPDAARVVCIGGAVLDRKYRAGVPFVPATSNPVDGFRSFGGVARNVAENLAALGVETSFISIVGNDETGRAILGAMRQRGINVSQVAVSDAMPTAEYVALIGPDNELAVAAADMRIFDHFTPDLIDRVWPHLASAAWVFADCNLPEKTLAALIHAKRQARFRLVIDAVSTPKVVRLPYDLDGVDLMFLNVQEAEAYLRVSKGSELQAHTSASAALTVGETGLKAPKSALTAAVAVKSHGAKGVIVTSGADGCAYATDEGTDVAAAIAAQPIDITGAGDAMIAATLHRLMAGDGIRAALHIGMLSATLTTETEATVHPQLSSDFLLQNQNRLAR